MNPITGTVREGKIIAPAPNELKDGVKVRDGLLVACCLDAGVRVLYTEDTGGSVSINGMEITNPFASQK